VTSSPAIGYDGTVYVGSNDFGVYAVDGKTGALKWSYATSGTVGSSPAIGSNGTVYVGSFDSKVYALDGTTGVLKWSYPTGASISSSPAIADDGTVYIGSNSLLVYALNGGSGVGIKWTRFMNSPIFSAPAIGDDGTIFVATYDGKLWALDGATGTPKWNYTTITRASITHSFSSSTPTPTVKNRIVEPVTKDNFDSDARVVPAAVTVTKSTANDDIDIDLVADGRLYGSVRLESKLVPVDWTVTVLPVNQTDIQKPKPTSSCDESSEKESNSDRSAIVSLAFNLIITDSKGRERLLEELLDARRSRRGIALQLTYDLRQFDARPSEDYLRFIYLRDGDSAWRKLEDSDIAFKDDFGNATATTTHLTSTILISLLRLFLHLHSLAVTLLHKGFAILFTVGEFGRGGCGSDNTLWIVSVSLLSFVIVISPFLVLLVERVPSLRRWFYGYATGAKSIRTIEKGLDSKKKNPDNDINLD